MSDSHSLAASLQASLELTFPPIAVSLVDEVPDGVPMFTGTVPAGCVFWQRAAEGAFATTTADHELCAVGVHTHNLSGPSSDYPTDLARTLEAMAGLGYVREEDVAGIPTVARPVRHVLYAPLASAPVPPDVVMLFAHSRQGLILAEAAGQLDPDAAPALGRPACAVVPQAMRSGRAALSLGCCGARAYLSELGDAVQLWAIPGARLAAYAERIAELAHANRVLTRFHSLRMNDIQSGGRPSVAESLRRLEAAG